ncbi:MAG TPA: PDZ domain-containing protein [Thermoanaerobaculia bacterium]|nr:PDZ domain-containing protein [Thermoanaerobaculia bacterium]
MNRRASLLFSLLFALSLAAAADPSIRDTRLLAEPAMSAERIAFIYANDLWTADLDGKDVRRLTSDVGVESSPAFSPDGKWIAFSAQYEGNTDVYVVGSEGGVPKRLTWHPGPDRAEGFTPDSKSVLFTSQRNVYTARYTQLFTVPVEGGAEELLPIPHSDRAVFSPDGKRIAYNPLSPRFLQWKRYRGGTVSQVWLYDRTTHAVEKVPQPEARANDAGPMWLNDVVYFRSDREGEFNLWSYDTKSKAMKRLTNHTDFPVLNASAGGGKIVYEQAGYLHLFDPASGRAKKLTIGVAADLPETRPRFARETKDRKYIRDFSISPTGVRLAVDFRGEIVTIPAEKGDVRNLTNSTAVHERSPIWSPDGKSIAYFSDESGEYELHIDSQDGKGKTKKFKIDGAGFYELPAWSPDSKKIAFVDNSRTLYWIDVASGAVRKVASDYFYGPIKYLHPSWSPDSKWIAYAINNQAYVNRVYAYSLEQNKAFPVTDGLSDVSEPVFDRSGKYLYFLASTDAGPVNNWFSLETADLKITRSIWLAVLDKNLPNPLVKESDEEKGPSSSDADKEKKKETSVQDEKDAKKGNGDKTDPKSDEKPKKAEKVPTVKIDFDGLQYRIIDLPVPVAEIDHLQAGAEGQLFFVRTADEKNALQRFDLKDRKTETMLPEIEDYQISADGKKVVYRVKDDWAIAGTAGKKIDTSEAKTLKTASIEVKVDPRAEWKEMFEDAWRINRDYFYDPNMHGVDWKGMRAKYSALLPDVAVRQDLNRVIRWMLSELSVGHSYITNVGDTMETKSVPGGLLGADYVIDNGRYKFAKVYGGLNWNPKLRSPLTEPGVNVKAGDYLIAVGGKDVKPPANLYSFFENTAGKLVEITVASSADGKNSRTVSVVPVESELAIRNRDWVEGNLRKVDQATGGRVAYVYVPNTSTAGYTYFKRYFYPQAYKDAVILDERFNGGGSLADYYIDVVSKKLIAYWAMRYGPDMKTPSASIQGPRVLIQDESAGSGGDLLPWMWRKFEVGPIVGTRTWGGLVGILGFPELMDGGQITAPNLAFYDPEKGWAVENEGVPPDIEVEMMPADVIAGRDPQLERAIAIVMDGLKKNPPVAVKRPPYPVKAGAGMAQQKPVEPQPPGGSR